MDRVSEYLTKVLKDTGGVKPDGMNCPDSVKAEKGATFTCKATFGKVVATITMVQTNDNGDAKIQSITGVASTDELEAKIVAMLDEQLHEHVKANCGDGVRKANAGDSFTCDATDENGGTYVIKVDIEDAAGNASMEVVSGPGAQDEADSESSKADSAPSN